MIDCKELRIGNYIHCTQFSDETVVEAITPSGISHSTISENIFMQSELSTLNPIPLTEEWLIKLGFEIKKGGISYDKDKLSIYFGETILSSKNGRTYFNSWAILEHTPKYVHSLQNLYFALTGEELTIN